ncbi:hypothetical protein BEL04_08590 [Mucilaginibacter sp. PPCGB 2223]|uniref:LytR/AlgR family response regulator transcription factor n=1 Tax=Mucilaginibacter sp. PPCGB 2223 TaxID=1886027 RepID=UPI000825F1D9|nr:LytTR family DNA-binding domain-containing protein [Mucilaginibacter sp. PPCGB 2223]OCX54306.1 hypothetical protein BEL04_08590 [Mucilaginibacter sp. PPCGB 2223]
MTLTCYIVDDEPHAITVLRDYIESTPELTLIGSSTDPLKALAEITAPEPPDITFIDVDMPGINGLEFARLTGRQTMIIFTTAFREYAVEAFERHAEDYLVKPVFYERFLSAVQRARQNKLNRSPIANPLSFFVKTGVKGKLVRVQCDEIQYIEGADAYIRICLKREQLMTYMTLSQVMKHLPATRFTRIHKSYIVQDGAVRVLEPGQVKLEDGTVLPIGPAYRDAFHAKLHDLY